VLEYSFRDISSSRINLFVLDAAGSRISVDMGHNMSSHPKDIIILHPRLLYAESTDAKWHGLPVYPLYYNIVPVEISSDM
jgi:hypothetical protein